MLKQFIAALEKEARSNFPPAIEEPANDFESAVNKYADIVDLQELVKKLMKPVNDEERAQRDAISESLRAHFGDKLKEGVNDYKLSNGRKLKLTHKIDRKIDESSIEIARDAYTGEIAFDDILRKKYELSKRDFDKLTYADELAISRMIVSKLAASTLKVD